MTPRMCCNDKKQSGRMLDMGAGLHGRDGVLPCPAACSRYCFKWQGGRWDSEVLPDTFTTLLTI